MSELNFRIILVPKEVLNFHLKDQLLFQVKSTVERCGLTHVSAQYSQVKKTEDEDYPEIEELTLEIRARRSSHHHAPKMKLYEEFCLNWLRYFYSLPTTYIEFYSNDSFLKCKSPYHRSVYQNVSFGVLPHNGMFYQFADLKNENIFEKQVDFYHDTRNVLIEFDTFDITFSYENIRSIFVNIEENPSKIYFDLFNPPIIFRIEIRNNRKDKHRNLNLAPVDISSQLRRMHISSRSSSSFLSPKIDADVLGRANVLCLTLKDPHEVRQILARIHQQCSEKSIYYSSISVIPQDKPFDPTIETTNFDCTYLITAMIRRNFILISQTSDIYNSLRRLNVLSQQNSDSLEKALTTVLLAVDSGKILNFWNAIESQYVYYTSNKDEINFQDYILPSKCSMIRRITLTPTRELLWPKEVMFSNRVLRNFEAEYAIRVSFREDNMSRLSFNAPYADNGVLESCIKAPMTNSIRIGSRKYEFLAWSNSQIRDHGVWMYARDTNGQTAAKIREWMGDFSHIRNVPKYMARMGQCFSQTEDALSVPLDPTLVRTEDDIEGGWDPVNNKPYCFSDGVGRMSVSLASQVHKALGHDKLCSAFQIRYGGCKGMLVIDPTLKDADIVFRKSMKKFDCPNSTRLEIAKTSGPVSLFLNRPVITLLNGLGVRHRMFLRLQENMLKKLTDMLFEESKAAEFLQSKTPTNLYNFEELSKSGIHLTTEPFFKALLLALHRHHIETIKLRANVSIDPNKGRNMLGVIDETSTLNYGEVFVQYSRDLSYGETTRDTVIHQGIVLVTKNPCMHPGDVRKFRAVNVPSLRHIVDCIVFPQRGHRPHPNEMAGSDLDGDEYFVQWDPDLIFHPPNIAPAHFPAVHSPDVPYINVSNMIDFLQEYIKNDHVGAIASAHLAHADRLGIFDPLCAGIAKKFSISVDFAKNGKSERLERDERPVEYPDFMENAHREMYKSEKALGKMYRVCKDFESENQVTSITYENIKVDPDLIYNGWEKYEDNARNARNKYNALFRSVLRNYGIQHEAEALSGAFTNLHCRFQERKDRNEIEKVIIGCIKKLYKSMHEEFMEEFLNCGDIKAIENAILQKASAWYIVTYSDPNAKFLSFPWSVSEHLANIKVRCTLGNVSPFSPAIMNLDKKILECESKLPSISDTSIWKNHLSLCDPQILKKALRTLILWAQEEEIIARPGYSQGLLYADVFVKLFLLVSEKQGYISRQHIRENCSKNHYSSGQLCMEFLKFCSTFRFYNKEEIKTLLSFDVYKHSKLGKCAIVSYHKFALSGTFHTLIFDKTIEKEVIAMKPMHIDSKIFSSSPISRLSLQKAEDALIKYSKVDELTLREITQTKKVWVDAKGSDDALKRLKNILRKKHFTLRYLFTHGIMQEGKF